LAKSIEHVTLDLRVMSSSPILGTEPTLKKILKINKELIKLSSKTKQKKQTKNIQTKTKNQTKTKKTQITQFKKRVKDLNRHFPREVIKKVHENMLIITKN